MVVTPFEEKVLIKGVVYGIDLGDEEGELKSYFSVDGSDRIHIEEARRIGKSKSVVISFKDNVLP